MASKRLFMVAVLVVAGCQSYDDGVRADLVRYIGRPARVFAEDKALTVTQVHDRPNGQRVYVMPYKMCGFTLIADPDRMRDEYITVEIVKAC